ncbi:FMN-binding negative transcriptional regulator [Sphingomonas sp. CV7422]|uniref:FMN-binding negative transcriptional regulator n=1 Tax=Sphingomonas sp. CV7422 TaxID=3018036 RepID=UPI0022FEA03F|nr:FMN-binding negative transcriptional regulator [Sphingomonas sp. CV7422]
MHPNPVFRADAALALDAAEQIGFAHVFAATEDGPMVVHAPITRHGDAVRFHVARANRITRHLDKAHVVLSLIETHGYISPNWYQPPGDQVPTWNFVAVEIEGIARTNGAPDLIAHLDRLATIHEPQDEPWHRDKMDPAAFERLLKGIRGFDVTITAVRGTTKLSQNKPAADRAGVVAGLRRIGSTALADRMAGEG